MVNTAFIKIWGELAGAVAWDESSQLASFEYDRQFTQYGWSLSPLTMPLEGQNRIFTFPELRKQKNSNTDTFKGLPGLLADVLPDKYGNQLINAWLTQKGRPANNMNPVEQLCFIGTRGMGALEFEPATLDTSKKAIDLEVDSLVDIAKKMLSKRENFSTKINDREKEAMTDILKIGTSAGGARAKAVIAFNKKTQQVKSGQTVVPKGYEHWLIKLDGVHEDQFGTSYGYGRVEMAYYLMARDCEIDMMESRMLEENGRAHFMTKRFDREGHDIKHHIQTWCGMKHFDFSEINSFSYEQLFQTMRELRLPYPDAEQMFRRMVFNVMASNCDDHTKNFAFRLKKDEKWSLAPAYDICHAYDPSNYWVNQHALSINGKRKGFSKSDFQILAKSMNIKKADKIISQTHDIVSQWPTYAEDVRVDSALRDAIHETLVLIG